MCDLLYLFMMNFNYVIRTPSTDQANTYGDTLGDAYDTDQPVPNHLDYDKWSRGFKRQLHFCGESSSKILMVIKYQTQTTTVFTLTPIKKILTVTL
jgi:hypothetical protein